jgi:hypothetical protein
MPTAPRHSAGTKCGTAPSSKSIAANQLIDLTSAPPRPCCRGTTGAGRGILVAIDRNLYDQDQ